MTSDCLSGTSRGHSKPGAAAAATATAGAGAGALPAAPAKIWDFTGRFQTVKHTVDGRNPIIYIIYRETIIIDNPGGAGFLSFTVV